MTTTRAKSVVVLLSVLSIIDVTPFNLRIFNVFETVLLVSLIVKGKKDLYILLHVSVITISVLCV